MEDSLLTCPICLEHFTDPVNLTCGHTYCRKCLIDITKKGPDQYPSEGICSAVEEKTIEQQTERVIQCPECRHVAILDEKGIDGLPKNFLVANMVERFEEDAVPTIPCDVCETPPPKAAEKICRQCNVSYCKSCFVELHPKRGAFAKHEILNAAEKMHFNVSESPSSDDQKDEQSASSSTAPTSNKSKQDMFCMQCQTIITDLEAAKHKGQAHTLMDLVQAKSQKMASLESNILSLERQKREVWRAIGDAESKLEITQEEERHQQSEISRGIDRIGEILQKNHVKLKTNTKKCFSRYCEVMEMEMDNARQEHVQITGLIGEARSLLETTAMVADLVTNIVSLEKRMCDFQNKFKEPLCLSNKIIDNPYSDLSHILRTMEEALVLEKTAENTDSNKYAQQPTHFYSNTMGSTTNKKSNSGNVSVEKVKIQKVQCRWDTTGSSTVISLEWEHSTGKIFNIKLETGGEDDRTTRELSNVKRKSYVVYKLSYQTWYRITVWVQGQKETEDFMEVHTLPKVNGTVLFDTQRASDGVKIDLNNRRMVDEQHNWNCCFGCHFDFESSHFRGEQLSKLDGTVGSPLKGDHNYWELLLSFHMDKLSQSSREFAFDAGICYESKVNKIEDLDRNYNAYICSMVKVARKTADMEFFREGKGDGSLQMKWCSPFQVNLGFFLNSKAKTFTILNVNEGSIMHTFKNVKMSSHYVPVFTMGNEELTNIKFILLPPEYLRIPDVVYDQLL